MSRIAIIERCGQCGHRRYWLDHDRITCKLDERSRYLDTHSIPNWCPLQSLESFQNEAAAVVLEAVARHFEKSATNARNVKHKDSEVVARVLEADA